jgi:replication fork clamp-binding protein CrfC
METTFLKKNSIQNLVGNEENGYPAPDLNKTMINVTKELSNAHKKNHKEEISEKYMEKLLDMVNQNVQDTLKKFQDQGQRTQDDTETNKGT